MTALHYNNVSLDTTPTNLRSKRRKESEKLK